MKTKHGFKNIDFPIVVVPVIVVVALFFLFMLRPEQSTYVLNTVRGFLGNELGSYYLVLGFGLLILTFGIAFSKYGKIKLGKTNNRV